MARPTAVAPARQAQTAQTQTKIQPITILAQPRVNPSTGYGSTAQQSFEMQQKAIQAQRTSEQQRIAQQAQYQQMIADARKRNNQAVVDNLHQEAYYKTHPNESPTYKAIESITPYVKNVRDTAATLTIGLATQIATGERSYINQSTLRAMAESEAKAVDVAQARTVLATSNKIQSTGRTIPANLSEKMAMQQAKADPEAGKILKITMNDQRWPSSDGWVKMSQKINGVDVHYVMNLRTGSTADFKFK